MCASCKHRVHKCAHRANIMYANMRIVQNIMCTNVYIVQTSCTQMCTSCKHHVHKCAHHANIMYANVRFVQTSCTQMCASCKHHVHKCAHRTNMMSTNVRIMQTSCTQMCASRKHHVHKCVQGANIMYTNVCIVHEEAIFLLQLLVTFRSISINKVYFIKSCSRQQGREGSREGCVSFRNKRHPLSLIAANSKYWFSSLNLQKFASSSPLFT